MLPGKTQRTLLREEMDLSGKPPEVRLNPDGSLDEVVAENAIVHLERMSDSLWWLSVESGGKTVTVWLSGECKISASHDIEFSTTAARERSTEEK